MTSEPVPYKEERIYKYLDVPYQCPNCAPMAVRFKEPVVDNGKEYMECQSCGHRDPPKPIAYYARQARDSARYRLHKLLEYAKTRKHRWIASTQVLEAGKLRIDLLNLNNPVTWTDKSGLVQIVHVGGVKPLDYDWIDYIKPLRVLIRRLLYKARVFEKRHSRWAILERTSPSGKTLFRCRCCQRVTPCPDKKCLGPNGREPKKCSQWLKP